MPAIQTRVAPKSGSSSPLRSSPLASHPPTMSSSPSSSSARPAPYMVALSGWPEPVYISNRSRPTTPRPSFPGEVSDGITLPPISAVVPTAPSSSSSSSTAMLPPPVPTKSRHGSGSKMDLKPGNYILDDLSSTTAADTRHRIKSAPAQSIFSKTCMYESHPGAGCPIPEDHPNHVAKYALAHGTPSQRRGSEGKDKSSAFPTSSARTPTHSPPPQTSPTIASTAPHPKQPQHHQPYFTSRHATFYDPRMAPNVAVLSNRPALPIAPNWTSASPTSTPAALPPALPNVGVKVPAGERGTGILVLRAVPDVYPPPHAPTGGVAGLASQMTRQNGIGGGHIGVATEVYPRDPDSAFLWGSGASPQVESHLEEDVDMDRREQW